MNTNEEKEREQMRSDFLKLFKYPMADDFESETFERGWKAGRAALRAESEPVAYARGGELECLGNGWLITASSKRDDVYNTPLYTAPQTEPIVTTEKPKLHALEYQSNGVSYGITIEGCNEEANAHAMRLGLTYLGQICEQQTGPEEYEIPAFLRRKEGNHG